MLGIVIIIFFADLNLCHRADGMTNWADWTLDEYPQMKRRERKERKVDNCNYKEKERVRILKTNIKFIR